MRSIILAIVAALALAGCGSSGPNIPSACASDMSAMSDQMALTATGSTAAEQKQWTSALTASLTDCATVDTWVAAVKDKPMSFGQALDATAAEKDARKTLPGLCNDNPSTPVCKSRNA